MPLRIEAKSEDHSLDFTGLIPPWKPDSCRLADNRGLNDEKRVYGE